MKRPIQREEWIDFLVLVALRFLGGTVLGIVVCFLYFSDSLSGALARDEFKGPVVHFLVAAFLGGIGAIVTIPRWQTPWYESVIEPITKKEKEDA